MKKEYSTAQVARLLAIGRATLHRWINSKTLFGKLHAPTLRRVGGVSVRFWTAADVERAREFKKNNYRKVIGRKLKR